MPDFSKKTIDIPKNSGCPRLIHQQNKHWLKYLLMFWQRPTEGKAGLPISDDIQLKIKILGILQIGQNIRVKYWYTSVDGQPVLKCLKNHL